MSDIWTPDCPLRPDGVLTAEAMRQRTQPDNDEAPPATQPEG